MLLEEERLTNLSMVDPVYETSMACYQNRVVRDKTDPSRRFDFSGFPLTNRGRTLCILLSNTGQLSFNKSYYNDMKEFYLKIKQ